MAWGRYSFCWYRRRSGDYYTAPYIIINTQPFSKKLLYTIQNYKPRLETLVYFASFLALSLDFYYDFQQHFSGWSGSYKIAFGLYLVMGQLSIPEECIYLLVRFQSISAQYNGDDCIHPFTASQESTSIHIRSGLIIHCMHHFWEIRKMNLKPRNEMWWMIQLGETWRQRAGAAGGDMLLAVSLAAADIYAKY